VIRRRDSDLDDGRFQSRDVSCRRWTARGSLSGDSGEQRHVIVDVVQDAEAEHDVARLHRLDRLEEVAVDELVPVVRTS